MNSDDYVSFIGKFKALTRDAILVSKDGEDYWIPRSVLDYTIDKRAESWERGQEVEVFLKQWFAEKKEIDYER